jgi:hypothetical protein
MIAVADSREVKKAYFDDDDFYDDDEFIAEFGEVMDKVMKTTKKYD